MPARELTNSTVTDSIENGGNGSREMFWGSSGSYCQRSIRNSLGILRRGLRMNGEHLANILNFRSCGAACRSILWFFRHAVHFSIDISKLGRIKPQSRRITSPSPPDTLPRYYLGSDLCPPNPQCRESSIPF